MSEADLSIGHKRSQKVKVYKYHTAHVPWAVSDVGLIGVEHFDIYHKSRSKRGTGRVRPKLKIKIN